MKPELEVQYADFQPGQVEKIGYVGLQQALNLIVSYPWRRELDKIQERNRQGLTSTVPNIAIRKNNGETLIISARDTDNFIIDLLTPSHRGEIILPNNTFENSTGFTTSDIVSKFYKGTIKQAIKTREINSVMRDSSGRFKLKVWPVFSFSFAIFLLAFILVLDFWSNGFTSKALPAVYFVIFFVIGFGLSLILTVQYLTTDWGKEVLVDKDGRLIIRQKGNEIVLAKKDIDHIVIVENYNHRTLSHFKYSRIRTKDHGSYIVTSFIIEPMKLINMLNVHHREESVFVPLIRYGLQTERQKQKIRRIKERMKNEFIETFNDYEDAKLRDIIRNKKDYADYAIAAATEILAKRSDSALNSSTWNS